MSFFTPLGEMGTFNKTPCNVELGSSDRRCYQDIINQFKIKDRLYKKQFYHPYFQYVYFRTCPCEVSCFERQFDTTVTMATWPSDKVIFASPPQYY